MYFISKGILKMRNRFFARSFAILIALFILTLGAQTAFAATFSFSNADNAYTDWSGTFPSLTINLGSGRLITFSAVPADGSPSVELYTYNAGEGLAYGNGGLQATSYDGSYDTRLKISTSSGYVFDLFSFKFASDGSSRISVGSASDPSAYGFYDISEGTAGTVTLAPTVTGVNEVYLSSEGVILFQDIVIDNILVKLLTPTGLSWDSSVPGKAIWNTGSYQTSYTVQLFKNGGIFGTVSNVTTPYYDFTDTIAAAGSGSYTYKVTSVGDHTAYADSDQSAASPAYSYAAFVAVTGISGLPASATVGTPLTLSGTVVPANATNKTITWSVVSAGATGASISGNTLSTTAAGTAAIRATIANGLAASSDYIEDFTVTVNAAFVPVTDITGLPTSATAGTSLTLSGTVEPASATNKTITWSVLSAGTTGATLSGNTLSTPNPGTILLEATVVNGLTASTHYHKYIYIDVFPPVPVTGITGLPTSATAGEALTLSGTVEPANATNKSITWSVISAGTTGASISGSTLSTTAAGTTVIRATIANGAGPSSDYTQDFSISVNPAFVPVTGITGLPTSATAGEALTLSGTVAPADATNKTITWSVIGVSTTGATISGNTLSTTGEGVALIRATVVNGFTASSDYTWDFMITVNPAVIPVTDITGLPTSATAGTSLTLSGTVEPSNATNKTITWSVLSAGTTGATLSGNTLSTPNPGTILLEATVVNGLTTSTHYHKYIYIDVFSPVPVTGISDVPTSATAGVALTLSGTVEPANATNKSITWSIASAGTTGASISGSTLSTTAAGTAVIRATIANGAGPSSDYTQDFSISVNPEMSEDTLTDVVGATTITAEGLFAPGAALVVTALAAGDDDREELEELMGDKQILGAYEAYITPAGAFTPPLTLTFEVGQDHNGSMVYILHKLADGTTEQFTPTVVNGAVSIDVIELSPFLIAKDFQLVITTQPQDARAAVGQTVLFSVWATGEAPLTYQWQRRRAGDFSDERQGKGSSGSWKRIDGATAPEYPIDRVDLSDNGSQYRVIVTDGLSNNVTSSAATLTVTKASSPDTGDHAQPALYALLAALFAAAFALLVKNRRVS